jgi:Yip1 domain
MAVFFRRLMGAALLDVSTYEEIEGDQRATSQALFVVMLSGLAAGAGAWDAPSGRPATALMVGTIAILAWAAWALLIFEIGARIVPEPQTRVDVGQLLRTIGFASTPGILRIFGILPGVTVPVFVLTAIWMLLATVVAVRQALDYSSTTRAVMVCVLGWTLAIVMAVVLGLLFGPRLA